MQNPFELITRRLDAIEDALHEIRLNHRQPTPISQQAAPIMSAKQVQTMTGWPPGTFYQKVSELPEGIVIRGKSKRLLFDTEKLLAYLKNPVQP